MSIDVLNFKKYFKKDSDATEAKIGHVNAALEYTTEFAQAQVATLVASIGSNSWADNADAIANGLQVGELYSTNGLGALPAGIVMVVVAP